MYSTRNEEYIEALNDGSSLYTSGCFLKPQKSSFNKKVDLVIWTKSNPLILDVVLKRINKVIPKDVVNKRLVVNDHSEDSTPMVIRQNGWTQIVNEGHGISDAANLALNNVETEWFVSVEQDVVLSEYWWNRISRLAVDGVAAVSGVRFLPQDNLCSNIERYNSVYQNGYGKTLDNTLWNTKALRSVGGFPKLKNAGLDTLLAEKFKAKGLKWIVDSDVQSLHLHKGLYDELRRYYFYGASLPELYSKMDCSDDEWSFFVKLLKSPVAALKMSLQMNDSRLMLSYPLVRLSWLLGYLRGRVD